MTDPLLDTIQFDEKGLIPAIAQDYQTGEVLMVAWMNCESLALTVKEQRAIYYSRSRQALWRKGESSGHVQHLKALAMDCDNDVLLLSVDQVGGIACHTGRKSCFYKQFINGQWQTVSDVLKDPKEIYHE